MFYQIFSARFYNSAPKSDLLGSGAYASDRDALSIMQAEGLQVMALILQAVMLANHCKASRSTVTRVKLI
jgi:hypothetical protein